MSDYTDLKNRLKTVEASLELTQEILRQADVELNRKNQIIAALKNRLFGCKSERYNPNQMQFDFGDVVLGKLEESCGDDKSSNKKKAVPGKRSKKSDLLPKNMPVVIVDILIPDEVRENPDDYFEISEEYHDELEVIKPVLHYNRTVRKKYKNKNDRSQPPVIAPAPLSSIPGTMCGPDLMAMSLVDKYSDHLPHYRQEDRFLRIHGAILSRQTINGWTHAAANHLAPIGEVIKNEIVNFKILQIDETPAKYLDPGTGSTSTGYLWYYRCPVSGTVYCDWQLGRGHECLLEMLGYDEDSATIRFGGTVQCDGYVAYKSLAKLFSTVSLAGCLAHIRRYFFEARAQAPDLVDRILDIIKSIYRYERPLRRQGEPPPDQCRFLVRRGHERPLVEELKNIIDEEKDNHFPRSKLGEALTYATNQWSYFVRCLADGRLEVDNNLIENAIRPAKLGLKNYMFIGSASAGSTTALMYTLIGNCKHHGVDPERYFAEVFRRLPHNASLEQAAELTPAKLADEIKASQPVPRKLQLARSEKSAA